MAINEYNDLKFEKGDSGYCKVVGPLEFGKDFGHGPKRSYPVTFFGKDGTMAGIGTKDQPQEDVNLLVNDNHIATILGAVAEPVGHVFLVEKVPMKNGHSFFKFSMRNEENVFEELTFIKVTAGNKDVDQANSANKPITVAPATDAEQVGWATQLAACIREAELAFELAGYKSKETLDPRYPGTENIRAMAIHINMSEMRKLDLRLEASGGAKEEEPEEAEEPTTAEELQDKKDDSDLPF